MRHNVCGRKLKRTKSHRDAMFANMATSLFEHKKLNTTEAKAKELRPFAEALITKAKNALAKEKQKLLPEGQSVDIHNRRLVARYIRSKAVVQELFDAIAPTVESRNGGYCRITKTGTRRGDAARTAIIELVDWSEPVDGAVSLKKKKKKVAKKPLAPTKNTKVNKIEETTKIEAISEALQTTNAVEKTEEIAETTEVFAPQAENNAEELKSDASENIEKASENTENIAETQEKNEDNNN